MTIENQTTNQQPQKAPELNLGDLQNLRSIIDAACRRGAFGGAELSSVGTVYDKLNTFLNAVAANQNTDQGTPAA